MNNGMLSFPAGLGENIIKWLTPIGAGMEWWGIEADCPKGFLMQDGKIYLIAQFPKLAKKLSNRYGGDGVTTFATPDRRGRVAVGKDDMGGTPANRVTSGGSGIVGNALGSSGGAETVALTAAQHAVHRHRGLSSNWASGSTGTVRLVGSAYAGEANTSGAGYSATYSDTDSAGTPIIENQGSGTAHQNMQPSIVCNYIIRAG